MTNKRTFRYNVNFHKKGDSVYISHLDLMLVFRRAMRRSGLPFCLTEGFTPRVRLGMEKALKLGVESENEKLSFWLREDADPAEAIEKLNAELPAGVLISNILS